MVDSDLAERCRREVEDYSRSTGEVQNSNTLSNYPITSGTPRPPTRPHTFRGKLIVALLLANVFCIYKYLDYKRANQEAQESQNAYSVSFPPPEVIERGKRDQEERERARAREAYEKSLAASDNWDDRTARYYIKSARENDPDNIKYMIEEDRLEIRAEIARQAGNVVRGIRDLFR